MKPIPIFDETTREDPHSLVPVEWNTQERTREELDRIKASIITHGVVGPIAARPSDRNIAGGHGRLEAILELLAEGYELEGGGVPVVWKECDDAELMALNMALNNATGQPSLERVAVAIREIEHMGRRDLLEAGGAGFTVRQLEDIRTLHQEPAGGSQWEQHEDDELADAWAEDGDDYEWSEITFSVTEDMNDVVQRALDKARRLGDTDNDAVALTYICADFLGTPDESVS